MRLHILDRALLAEVDRCLQQGASLAGDSLACRPSCTDCCIGVFTINLLDAWRLHQGLKQLEGADPARARAIQERATRAICLFEEDYPGNTADGLLDEGETKIDLFTAKYADSACPALDPASGLCDLYACRPMTCRTFGLPVVWGNEKLPPCSLCFRGSSREEIEACRVEPDPDGLEDAILSELWDHEVGDSPETIVAYALILGKR